MGVYDVYLVFLEEWWVSKYVSEVLEASNNLPLGVLTPPQEATHRADHLLSTAHCLQLCHSLLAGHLWGEKKHYQVVPQNRAYSLLEFAEASFQVLYGLENSPVQNKYPYPMFSLLLWLCQTVAI